MWTNFPTFPGLLDFKHTAYEARYTTSNGKILLTAVPVYGEYSQFSPSSGSLVGFQISFIGYSGFIGLSDVSNIKEYLFTASIRLNQ